MFVVGWPDADAVAVGRPAKLLGRRDACHDPVFVSGSQIRQEWGGLVVRLEQGKVDGVRVLVGRLAAQGDEVVLYRQRGLAVFDDAHGNAPSGAARQHELERLGRFFPARSPGPFPGLAVQRPLLNGHEHDGFHRVDAGREVRIGDGKDGAAASIHDRLLERDAFQIGSSCPSVVADKRVVPATNPPVADVRPRARGIERLEVFLAAFGEEHAVDGAGVVAVFDDVAAVPYLRFDGSGGQDALFLREVGGHVIIEGVVALRFALVVGARRGGVLRHPRRVRAFPCGPFARCLQVGYAVLSRYVDGLRRVVVFGELEIAQIVVHAHADQGHEYGKDGNDRQQFGHREPFGMFTAYGHDIRSTSFLFRASRCSRLNLYLNITRTSAGVK